MKKLKKLIEREFNTYANVYVYLLVVKVILLLSIGLTILLTEGTLREALLSVLIFLFTSFIILTVPLLLGISMLKDRSVLADIKLLPISSFSYFLIKFCLPILLIIPEVLICYLFSIEVITVSGPFYFLFLIPFVAIAIIFFVYSNTKFDYRGNMLLITLAIITLSTVAAFITIVNYFIATETTVNSTVVGDFIPHYIFLLIVNILAMYIWSLLFDKKSEI